MSSKDNDDFRWRETYFVFFRSADRPSLATLEKKLKSLGSRFQIKDSQADEKGRVENVTLLAPHDSAAMEINFQEGEDVSAQALSMRSEIRSCGEIPLESLDRLGKCDAGFEVMHFEQAPGDEEEDFDEAFDPTSLLMVMDLLVNLTGGLGIDPQSGTLIC